MNPKLRIIPVAIVLIAIIAWLVVRSQDDGDTVMASGTIEATEAMLGFLTPGRIDSIGVSEGQTVTRGAVLAWLDRNELVARRHAAEAQLASARARLQELEAGFRTEEIAQGRAAVRAANERYADAQREFERAERLFGGGAISEQQRDRTATNLEIAEAELERTAQQLQLFERGFRSEQVASQRAMVQQAVANLAQVDVALEHALIIAPFDGVISVRHREPGEVVGAGAVVLTLQDPNDRWVRIFVPENRVGRLQLGQSAVISADAYPDERYRGEITFIADEAEFTPRNVQTTEERVKLVFRVKVRVVEDRDGTLKPGLPADVLLDTPSRE
jgi:HlyD family secretion protein